MPALRIPSLLRLVIAKDRNLKALEDREVQKKVSNPLTDTSVQVPDRRQRIVRAVPGYLYAQAETTQAVYADGDIEKHRPEAERGIIGMRPNTPVRTTKLKSGIVTKAPAVL